MGFDNLVSLAYPGASKKRGIPVFVTGNPSRQSLIASQGSHKCHTHKYNPLGQLPVLFLNSPERRKGPGKVTLPKVNKEEGDRRPMFRRNGGRAAHGFVSESDHVQRLVPAQIRMPGFLEQKHTKATKSRFRIGIPSLSSFASARNCLPGSVWAGNSKSVPGVSFHWGLTPD